MAKQLIFCSSEKYNEYNSQDTINPNALYFCDDQKTLYHGKIDYSEQVIVADTTPANPINKRFYYIDGELKLCVGHALISVTNDLVTYAGSVLDSSASNTQTPSAKMVYESIKAAVENVTGVDGVVNSIKSTKAGTITVASGANSDDVAIKGVVINPTYDNDTRTITLPYADGTESLIITLGKDAFVESGSYNTPTQTIDLVLTSGETVSIPAADLITQITGGETSTTKTTVDGNNEITTNIKVSETENNLLDAKDDGLYVADNTDVLKEYADTVSASTLNEAKAYCDDRAIEWIIVED